MVSKSEMSIPDDPKETRVLLKKLKSVTIQDAVYEELVQAIISGRIKPGEKITLEAIAKDLDVSIMPVREAMRRLEERKFVTIQRNRKEFP